MFIYRTVLIIFALTSIYVSSQEKDLAAVKALSAQYEENRIKFNQGRLVFEFTDAYAKNFEDALRDQITEPYTASGFYAYKGDMAVYKCDYSTESIRAASKSLGKHSTSTRLNPIHMATNGKKTILDRISASPTGEIGHGVTLKGGNDDFYSLAQVPFELGFPVKERVDLTSIAKGIEDHLPGLSIESIENEVTIDGVKTIKITFKFATGSKTLWIDPERSSVPLRVHDKYKTGSEAFYSYQDIRYVPQRGWLPFRQVMFAGGSVKKIVVTHVDFSDVSAEAFRLDFDEPRAILDDSDRVIYPAQKTWDLSRLPSRTAPGTLRVADTVSEPVMPAEIPHTVPIFTYGALGACLLILFIVLVKRWLRT